MKILVTGAAGFIGFHLSRQLCARGDDVFGIDNLNSYYDPNLKKSRLAILEKSKNFSFKKIDISDRDAVAQLFREQQFDCVVNLAAQAGVRYSILQPYSYIDTNLVGFANVLENCRQAKIKNFIFASSSSVYGANKAYPLSEKQPVDHPVALYGATKKANEIMAHSYAHLYQLPCTGLRFFTVYGPWGRPDMALFKFTENILHKKPIDVYNFGDMWRDFTYIDDIVSGIIRVIDKPASGRADWDAENPELGSSYAPYRVYNIGHGSPINLLTFIETLEAILGVPAEKNFMPMQPGDVVKTFADTKALEKEMGYKPAVGIREGITNFIQWYYTYYNVKTSCVE